MITLFSYLGNIKRLAGRQEAEARKKETRAKVLARTGKAIGGTSGMQQQAKALNLTKDAVQARQQAGTLQAKRERILKKKDFGKKLRDKMKQDRNMRLASQVQENLKSNIERQQKLAEVRREPNAQRKQTKTVEQYRRQFVQ